MNVILETNPLYVSQAGIARYLWGLIAGFAEMPLVPRRLTETTMLGSYDRNLAILAKSDHNGPLSPLL